MADYLGGLQQTCPSVASVSSVEQRWGPEPPQGLEDVK